MKKRLSSFLLSFLIFMLIVPFHCVAEEVRFDAGSYLVTSNNGVKLYQNLEESVDFNTCAPKGTYLNVIRTVGDYGYTVYDSVYGWVNLKNGTEYVSSMPTLKGGKIEGVKGLEITRLPDKLTYIEGEDPADIDGMEVSLVFNDSENSKMKITGYNVAFPNLDTYGEKQVTVWYAGFSASYPIKIYKVPVTGIVITFPYKTAYVEGEPVSFDGLTVTAYYSDGRDHGKGILLPESEYTVTGVREGDAALAPGVYTVTVTYKYPEISASFHVFVSGRSVRSLSLIKMPADPTIYQGQTFKTSDFELSAVYDNSLTETITDFDIEYDNMTVGTYTARIYYMDKYVAFDYTVLPLEETGISLGDTSAVGSYVGNDINFGNLTVYKVYNSGEKKLTDGYELIYDIDKDIVGNYPVKVVCGEFFAEFDYTVAQRPQYVLGDVDGDGKITAGDARLALRFAAHLDELSETASAAADVDFNGKVTASDARKILRVSARLDSF